jgi:hypothetical protein
MKLKTSELTGAALDWAVAKCEQGEFMDETWWADFGHESCYSTDWAHGGPIIEREKIEMAYRVGVHWIATRVEGSAICEVTGPTQLVAAMRCYVKSQLGDEMEVPDDIAWDSMIYEKGEE